MFAITRQLATRPAIWNGVASDFVSLTKTSLRYLRFLNKLPQKPCLGLSTSGSAGGRVGSWMISTIGGIVLFPGGLRGGCSTTGTGGEVWIRPIGFDIDSPPGSTSRDVVVSSCSFAYS